MFLSKFSQKRNVSWTYLILFGVVSIFWSFSFRFSRSRLRLISDLTVTKVSDSVTEVADVSATLVQVLGHLQLEPHPKLLRRHPHFLLQTDLQLQKWREIFAVLSIMLINVVASFERFDWLERLPIARR